jgi:hypothetical protein
MATKLAIQAQAPQAPQYGQGDIVTNEAGDRMQLSGDKWVPIDRALTPEQQQLSQRSPAGAFFDAAGEGLVQLHGGAQSLLGSLGMSDGGVPMSESGMAQVQQSRARMKGLEAGNPNAAMLGRAVPEVLGGLAVGAATGGAGLLPMVAAEGAYGAGIGALGSPEDPLTGAAIGGGLGMIGGGIGGAAVKYGGRMADRVLGRVGKAADDAAPAPRLGGQSIEDFTANAESLGLQVPISVRRQSPFLENVGSTLESSPATSWMTGGAQKNNQMVLEQAARKAAGLDPESVMTPESLRIARKAAGDQFESYLDKSAARMSKDEIRTTVEGAISDSFVDRGKFLKKMDSLLNDFKGETLTSQQLHQLQTAMDDLASKGGGGAMKQKQAARQAIIEKLAPSSSVDPNLFRDAQRKWAALSALEKAIGPRGTIRSGSLAKNLVGGKGDTEIANLANIAESMNYMRPSTYGTENARRGGLAGLAATGLGGVGLGAIFSP